MAKPTRYLILPARGLQATSGNTSTAARDFLINLSQGNADTTVRNSLHKVVIAGATAVRGISKKLKPKIEKVTKAAFEVLSSIHEDGVKLVNATPEMVAALRFEQPGVRAVPEVFYEPALFRAELKRKITKLAAGAAIQKKLKVTVIRADNSNPVKDVHILAFTDLDAGEGTEGFTGASGTLTLSISGAAKYERIYGYHEHVGLWTYMGKNINTSGDLEIKLVPVDLAEKDSLRHFHTIGADTDGSGVRVGVIDSGIDLAHADLKVAGGLGCVPDEPENDFGHQLGGSHGSHVAGIIAGRGKAPSGMRGIAPGAEIFSYRVFGQTDSSGSNFALVKAIGRGIEDKCDILNMSLSFKRNAQGLSPEDDAVKEALREAHKNGVLVLAAAGNDGRLSVGYPARDDFAIAVSAIGRTGTFPSMSSEAGDMKPPKVEVQGEDNFVAAFSNIGDEIDVAGAGVGVVSTVPGGYSPMSGTSMACPAVAGVVARLLASNPTIRNMPRDSARTEAIKSLLFAQAKTLGFELKFEGKGLPK